MSEREQRTLSVPEGVAGERIDSALTRVLGLSRTAVVKLLDDGDITTSGKAMSKSDRVAANQIIEVLMPAPINQDPIPLTPLEGLTIVYDDDGNSSSNLLKHVESVIRNFGVKIQVLPFNNSIKNTKLIQGQLLICMGDNSGSYFSGEVNPVENLREIIFETSNCNEQEIPVIVTHSLKQLFNATPKKMQLWNDLIFARNIYLDTMSDGI